MTDQSRCDLVLVGAPPPPYHGQALVTQQVFEMDWNPIRVCRIEARFSDNINEVGKAGFRKVKILLNVIRQMLIARFAYGGKVLYITAGSANWVPLIRDVLLIGFFGRFYSRVFVHYHSGGLPEWFSRSKWANFFGKIAYGRAYTAIGLSKAVTVPRFGSSKLAIVPNGIERSSIANELVLRNYGKNCRNMVFLGALRPGKGVDVLLDAIEILSERGINNLEIQLVGDWISEDYKQKTVQRLKGSSWQNRVIFPGVLTGTDKWKALAEAEFFVFPSHYESENQPLVVIEALSMGLPVITTKWRGIPEMIKEGETGFLVEPNRPEELARVLEDVLMLPEQQLKILAENCYKQYEQNYSAKAFSARMQNLLMPSCLGDN